MLKNGFAGINGNQVGGNFVMLVILGIIFFFIGYVSQAVCIRSTQKIIRIAPLICYVFLAIICFVFVYLAFRGYIIDGENLLGYYMGPIIFEAVCIIIFATSFAGILLAGIVYGIINRKK